MAAHQASTTSESSSQYGRGALWIHSAVNTKKTEVSVRVDNIIQIIQHCTRLHTTVPVSTPSLQIIPLIDAPPLSPPRSTPPPARSVRSAHTAAYPSPRALPHVIPPGVIPSVTCCPLPAQHEPTRSCAPSVIFIAVAHSNRPVCVQSGRSRRMLAKIAARRSQTCQRRERRRRNLQS